MKFDVDRVLSFAKGFDTPRLAGTEGERAAADRLAAEFEMEGWNVEKREAIGSRFPSRVTDRIVWIVAGLLGALIVHGPNPWNGICLIALLLWMLADFAGMFDRLGRNMPPKVVSPLVIARRTGKDDGPCRIVFTTHLDTNPNGWAFQTRGLDPIGIINALVFLEIAAVSGRSFSPRDHWIVIVCAAVGAILIFSIRRLGKQKWMRRYGWALFGAAIFTLVIHEWGSRLDVLPIVVPAVWLFLCATRAIGTIGPSELGGDRNDPVALGMLAEWASSWSSEACETCFAAVGGRTVGQSGATELARMIGEEWPKKPTLVVHLHNPGRSPKVLLVMHGRASTLNLVAKAVADLWIPREEEPPFFFTRAPSLGHLPFERAGIEAITIAGEAWTPVAKQTDGIDPGAIRPNMVAATAVLVREIALRWAKAHASPAA